MRRVVTEEEIKSRDFHSAGTTRAFFRGRSVAQFNDQIESIQWDEIVFQERKARALGEAAGSRSGRPIER